MPKSGWITTSIPNIYGQIAEPKGLTIGPDQKIWAAVQTFDGTKGAISKVAMDQHVTSYPISIVPDAIAFGSDQNLWVTSSNGVVARVTPAGVETDYAVAPRSAALASIIPGPDGRLWFIECSSPTAGGIGAIATSGSSTLYATGCEQVLAVGSDGNIWFGDAATLANMTPQGVMIGQYAVGDNYFSGIASGSDGALYVLGGFNSGSDELVRVQMDGTIGHIADDRVGDALRGIASGPDGNLWISAVKGGSRHLITFDPASQSFTSARIKAPAWGPNMVWGPDDNLWMLDRSRAGVYTYLRTAMTLSPRPITVQVGHTANLNVTETNYSGQWTAASKNQSTASVTANSNNGTFVVTGVAAGTTFVTVSDTMYNSASVKVSVH
ncbi:MAG TPA: Ig-like domain-containing protein [Candidatus Eremiobacteraceae bacterium]